MKPFYLFLMTLLFSNFTFLMSMENPLIEKYDHQTKILNLSNQKLTNKDLEKLITPLIKLSKNFKIQKINLENNKLQYIPKFFFFLQNNPKISVKNNPLEFCKKKRNFLSNIVENQDKFTQVAETLFGKQAKQEKKDNFIIMLKDYRIVISPELKFEQQELKIDDKTTLLILKLQKKDRLSFFRKHKKELGFIFAIISSIAYYIGPTFLEIIKTFICG